MADMTKRIFGPDTVRERVLAEFISISDVEAVGYGDLARVNKVVDAEGEEIADYVDRVAKEVKSGLRLTMVARAKDLTNFSGNHMTRGGKTIPIVLPYPIKNYK